MATEKLDTRTALVTEAPSGYLIFFHNPGGLSYKQEFEVFKAFVQNWINEGQYLDYGGLNQVSAAQLRPIVDGDVEFVDTTDGFTISNQIQVIASQDVPNARLEGVNGSYTFTNGIQDLTNLGGGYQSTLSAINMSNFTGFSIQATDSRINLQSQVLGAATAAITIENAKIEIRTPDQIVGTATVNSVLELVDIATGETEYRPTRWTTVTRPTNTAANYGIMGYNSTLDAMEYLKSTGTWTTLQDL